MDITRKRMALGMPLLQTSSSQVHQVAAPEESNAPRARQPVPVIGAMPNMG